MALRYTKLTSKGQLTIPIEFRRALGIEAGDNVAVERVDNTVVLRRSKSVAQETAGILSAYRLDPPPTPQELREAFEEAVALEQLEDWEANK